MPNPNIPYPTRLLIYRERQQARAQLLTDLLDLKDANKQISVSKGIAMIADLQQHGRQSRYLKHEAGPVWELKTRTPEGGMRIYVAQLTDTVWGLGRAECKDNDAASDDLLDWVADAVFRFRQGQKLTR